MTEKILKTKKNGMQTLVIILITLVAALALLIFGLSLVENESMIGAPLAIIGGIWLCIGWVPLIGLKVLKPEEALVLTLFGKYVGTIKGEGFYAVNPFCVAVNPAANTKLNQSGDVNTIEDTIISKSGAAVTVLNKKLSLKIMTLSNNKQKIN